MILPLDLAAKVDKTTAYLCAAERGPVGLDLPAPGRPDFPEDHPR